MLIRLPHKNVERGLKRQWFTDDYLDLIIWHKAGGALHGFQLCYGKPCEERALTWTQDQGFRHNGIDSGESSPFANQTPILVADGKFPAEKVRQEFLARSQNLPPEISTLVLTRLSEYENKMPSDPLRKPRKS